ncbi:DNA topoisomerase III [Halalkalibacter akibai]|uniref:DNA topoisomerase 3 n=1 Tax=Halalkalibacter akibai (strain ATCC 43226 / DSM 21942 / CIP 109018 / JCM 9157 / 1139) TaxID=1236973 RepID=W4QRH1_HALA3|nr:DNA topoisomerase III [Halalkalibacter akibai]GAE34517.1 DNA topoisomerase III [Halalkalibacter akibai JCM 9157]
MSKTVVLAEKPSVARDIARVLGCNQKGNGFFEGNRFIVTWALGHLVTLAEPESYGDQYKTWKLEDLPMLPQKLQLVVMKQTSKQFHAVKAQMQRKDVKDIVIATDAGREGELVARWILAKVHVQKPLKRLWISSVTDRAIKEGFQKLKDAREYEGLYQSAVARSEADWYVGINGTRALTTKFNAQLSCGRVQTPTLAMIAKREQDIQSFKPVPFEGLTVETNKGMTFQWVDEKTHDRRIFAIGKAPELQKQLANEVVTITDIKTVNKKTPAPLLYDLTELQRESNKRFGYSAKETLSILQRLYEQHKVLTYPRTDSKFLSSDMVDTLHERIKACDIQPFRKIVAQIKQIDKKKKYSFINDQKVSDHHAIIPTEQSPSPTALSEKESKIYRLVVKRFLAVFFEAYEYDQTTISASIGSGKVTARGKQMTQLGWKVVYQDDAASYEEEESEPSLPKVSVGEKLPVAKLVVSSGQTQPPSRLTEGTLLAAMERPMAYLTNEDKDLAETLGKTGGIGTVATRADIIEKLINTHLIEKRGKDLHITKKGKQLLDLVPDDLQSPALTAEWELKLEKIANGKLDKNEFVKEMKQYAKDIVQAIKRSEKTFKHDNVTGSPCPDCGKLLLEVNSKHGKRRVCQDPACGYKKNVSKVTNARCPKCKKKLEIWGEGEGQTFACVCGHREKLSNFQERRKQNQHKKVSKKEVANYMKKQHKEEEFMNTALADALAKLKKQ